MIRLAVLLMLLSLLVSSCGQTSHSASKSGDDTATVADDRPGAPEVYSRIESMTDCDALQAEFNQADKNTQREQSAGRLDMALITTSYMDADKRMREVGCYG